MTSPPDTIDRAFELMKAGYIGALVSNAADAFVAGEVRASRQLGLDLNFHLVNSRAVEATKSYRETLVRFGGSEVTEIVHGRATRVFKPWLKDAAEADKEEIGKIIRDAIETGKPLRQVEDALDEVFAMREHNAKLTAYQETKQLYNKGTMDRYVDEGIQRGIFHHMDPQEHPREEHQAMDGQTVDINDPSIQAELDKPFCHCWIEPITGVLAQRRAMGEE